jgi:hypothetical protein
MGSSSRAADLTRRMKKKKESKLTWLMIALVTAASVWLVISGHWPVLPT